MTSSVRNAAGCGAVVVLGAGLCAALALMAADFDLRTTTEVSVLMEDALGVGPGADVMVAGVKVGRVGAVGVEHDRARVTLEIFEGADVRSDARVRMRAKSVLGEKYIEILPQSLDAASIEAGDELPPSASHTEIDELVDALGVFVASVDPAVVQQTIESLNTALQEDPDRLARMLRNADETLSNTAEASRAFKPTIGEARGTLARANRAMSTLEARGEEAKALVERANRVLERLDAVVEPGPELVAEAEATLAEVRAALEPMGTASRDLAAILENFSDVDEESLRVLLREEGVRVHLFGDGKKRRKEK